MDSAEGGRCGDIASDLSIILVTIVQLVFFTSFHKYIAWPATAPDGTVTRLSMLTDGYSAWLPFVVVASILVIVASLIMIIFDNQKFRQLAWIGFSIIGIVMVLSLLTMFPFDFSVIPDATTAGLVPKALTAFLIFMGILYMTTALVLSVRFIKGQRAKQETG